MVTSSVLETLRSLPFGQAFTPVQVDRLATLAKRVKFERNQVIFREGDEASQLYVIVWGMVGLEIVTPDRSFRVETLTAGDEFGWSALLTGRGKHFQARALDRVDALSFEGADLRAMCEDDTAFGYVLMLRLLGVVSERLQATRLQVLDMYWPVAKAAGA